MTQGSMPELATNICAVLFDNDGTLVDSEALCNLALQQQFANYGVELSLDELILHYRGGKLSDIFNRLCFAHHIQRPVNYELDYRTRLNVLFNAALKPIDGAADLLQHLQRNHFQLAVVSNGPPQKMRHTLGLCQLLPFFDSGDSSDKSGADNSRLFSAYDCGLFKPDPGLYLDAIQRLGLKPCQCAIVEDSLPGVQAGLAAGVRTYFLNHYAEDCPAGAIEIKHLSALKNIYG